MICFQCLLERFTEIFDTACYYVFHQRLYTKRKGHQARQIQSSKSCNDFPTNVLSFNDIGSLMPRSKSAHVIFRRNVSSNLCERSNDMPRKLPAEHQCESIITDPVPSDARVIELEKELADLRSQIAQLLSEKEVPKITNPPPPPPPPPPLAKNKISFKPKNTSTPRPRSSLSKASQLHANFSDVLKDIGNVKLKNNNIERSPGGTPLRIKKSPTYDENDPAHIIARVLKQKFSNLNQSDQSSCNNSFSDSFN